MSAKNPIIIEATRLEALRRAGELGYRALLGVHGPAAERRKLADEAQAAAAIVELLSTPSGAADALAVLKGQEPPAGFGAVWSPDPTKRPGYAPPPTDKIIGAGQWTMPPGTENRSGSGAVQILRLVDGRYELRMIKLFVGGIQDQRGMAIYFSDKRTINRETGPRREDVKIGDLQAMSGDQRYPLPGRPDPEKRYIHIYSARENQAVLFADLRWIEMPAASSAKKEAA